MTVLVLPMAGEGSRFQSQGYKTPKPLLPIGQFKMYEIVLANLFNSSLSEVCLVTQRGMVSELEIRNLREAFGIPVWQEVLDSVTDGAARTVSAALSKMPTKSLSDQLVVANSDQYLDADLSEFYRILRLESAAVLTMFDDDPKWSYARTDGKGRVLDIKEKQVISRHATAGVYGFDSSHAFLEYFTKMTANEDRVNGEYYVAPLYNYARSSSRPVAVSMGEVGEVMHGLGTPKDYERFLLSPARVRAEDLAKARFHGSK